jgi:hypothetical protein
MATDLSVKSIPATGDISRDITITFGYQSSEIATNISINRKINGDDDATRRGSNSDDDDKISPAKSRRRAQNRAA